MILYGYRRPATNDMKTPISVTRISFGGENVTLDNLARILTSVVHFPESGHGHDLIESLFLATEQHIPITWSFKVVVKAGGLNGAEIEQEHSGITFESAQAKKMEIMHKAHISSVGEIHPVINSEWAFYKEHAPRRMMCAMGWLKTEK